MRRKTHERIVAGLHRQHAEEVRRLYDVIDRQADRLMWLVGVPYQSNQQPEQDEPEPDVDELPATAVEQYADDNWG